MEITKEFWFSMGHCLTDYAGKCYHFHGHNYRLAVSVEQRQIAPRILTDNNGMVMDFGEIKTVVESVLDKFDHKFYINSSDARAGTLVALDPEGVRLVKFNPTAENLVIQLRTMIADKMRGPASRILSKIVLWETEDSFAEWQPWRES